MAPRQKPSRPGTMSRNGFSIRMIRPDDVCLMTSWSESHLKAFLDRHGIPCPQPHTRDKLLAKARSSYQDIRNKAGDTAAAPGNWLYETWSDSDLKSWCDYRGIPVPQGSKRNEVTILTRLFTNDSSSPSSDGICAKPNSKEKTPT